jgi:uncharacterized protein (TIGR03435 family)
MLLWPLLMFFAQVAGQVPSFEVASVRPSQASVGPDYNNRFTHSPSAFTARNATLKALIAEAYRVQRRQVLGPAWIDQNEYDIDARANRFSSNEEMATMLQGLLSERFNLRQHKENRVMRVFELIPAQSGSKLQPIQDGASPKPGAGFHFHGDMRQFADLLAAKVSTPPPSDPAQPAIAGGPPVPMLDRTGLQGIYDFNLDIRPELGTDGLTLWRSAVQEQLGLRIESRKETVTVLAVDAAAKVPTAN